MNWIKITPETELPKEEVLAIFEWDDKEPFYEVGMLIRDMRGIPFCRGISNPTHYCIITKPEE